MSESPSSRLRDPDLLKVGDALLRASLKAQELALRMGTPCYVWENGERINIGAPVPPAEPPPGR